MRQTSLILPRSFAAYFTTSENLQFHERDNIGGNDRVLGVDRLFRFFPLSCDVNSDGDMLPL